MPRLRLASSVVVIAAALLAPAQASGAVSCDAGANLQVIAGASNDLAQIERSGGNIAVRDLFGPVTCTGGTASASTIGAIQLTKPSMTTQNVTFIVEDAAGMGPGGVDEGDGSSEIEIFVNLAGGTSHLLSVRFVPVRGSFTRAATAGTNRFRFTGRLRGRALARGRYPLRATPRGGATTRTAFRIVR